MEAFTLPRGIANRHGSKKEDGEDKNFQDHTTACENIDDISTEVLKAGMYLSVSVTAICCQFLIMPYFIWHKKYLLK